MDLLDWVLNHRHLIGPVTGNSVVGVSVAGSISSVPIASNVTESDTIATAIRGAITALLTLSPNPNEQANAQEILRVIDELENLYSVDKENVQTKETKAR